MTEQWKIEAAKRFNDKIRMKPTDWYWGQVASEPVAKSEPLVEITEMILEAQEQTYNWWLDTIGLGKVA